MWQPNIGFAVESLSAVSETALFTLKARVLESEKARPVINDPVGRQCLAKLQSLLPPELQKRVFNKKLSSILTRYIALRARKYDQYAKSFLKENPDGLVVSLGCGFDTRYWRVSGKPWRYIELDLPEVIALKKNILKDKVAYQMLGCSVLDESWINKILSMQNSNVLFLAEGLLIYLPAQQVIGIFEKLSRSFANSQIVFEVVNKKYTRGFWKKVVELKMKRAMGSTAGSSFDFGVGGGKDVEGFGDNINVVEQWSVFEDSDIKPRFLYLLKNFQYISRVIWTIKATIA